jgi:hypothetical protein
VLKKIEHFIKQNMQLRWNLPPPFLSNEPDTDFDRNALISVPVCNKPPIQRTTLEDSDL